MRRRSCNRITEVRPARLNAALTHRCTLLTCSGRPGSIHEHQALVGVSPLRVIPLRHLLRPPLPQDRQPEGTQVHAALLMGLGWTQNQTPAGHGCEAAAHDHTLAVNIDIRPAQAQEFAAAQPAEHREHQQRIDRIRLVGLEEPPDRQTVEHGDCALWDARQFDHEPPRCAAPTAR